MYSYIVCTCNCIIGEHLYGLLVSIKCNTYIELVCYYYQDNIVVVISIIYTSSTKPLQSSKSFLNQARAGRTARAWFLKITSVRMYVCVSVSVSVCPPPRP